MKKDNPKTIALIASILVMVVSISGCMGSDKGSNGEESERTYMFDTHSFSGHLEGRAQASDEDILEEIHFEINAHRVTRIRINVTVLDGDENTKIDEVESIRMWRETGGEPLEIKTVNGGPTPYTASIEFNYTGEEGLVDWWIVEIGATIRAGEDQWIGPIIWNGVPDNGIDYMIDADYDHYLEDRTNEQ